MKNASKSGLLLVALSIPFSAWAALPSAGQKADAKRFAVKAQAAKSFSAVADVAEFAAFRNKTSPDWKVRYSPETGIPANLYGGKNLRYLGDAETAARLFLRDHKSLLKVEQEQLKLEFSKESLGIRHLYFNQSYKGLPVENSAVRVHIKDNGDIVYYQSRFRPDITVSLVPTVDEAQAAAAVKADSGVKHTGKGGLVLFPYDSDGKVHLAWKIEAGALQGGGRWAYYVDAHTGKVLFRYSLIFYATSGQVYGNVFPLFPHTSYYTDYSTQPIKNQYVWVQNYQNVSTTTATGAYTHPVDGKVFASLKGPYFSVINFQGVSASYDNGGSTWAVVTTTAASPHPYENDAVYTATISLTSVPQYFAKMLPHFKAGGLDVGNMDANGDIIDYDELHILHPASGAKMASYIGWRTNGFYGAPIENPSCVFRLESNSSGQYYGFDVDYSSYMYLTSSPTVYDNATSTFTWNSARTNDSSLDQVNVFYHLNEMHDFYNNGVNSTGLVNIDRHLPVMVHASGSPDDPLTPSMHNAFYDSAANNMMFGDGQRNSTTNKYASFSLDATIIRHEYTHFAHSRIYPFFYFGESGAISEAMADYWSLSSLRQSDSNLTPLTSKLGEFLSFVYGPSVMRDLSSSGCPVPGSTCKVYPDSWVSEVHDDSVILSQALWEMRYPTYANWLGVSGSDPRSDVFVWNSLLFFPDTLVEFRDAMEYVCGAIEGANCSAGGYLAKMQSAFDNHGIKDPPSGGDSYEPNGGMEIATDASSVNPLSATVYPAYDVDFYSLPLPAGRFTAVIQLPPATNANTYHAFSLLLLSGDRQQLKWADPVIANPDISTGYCPNTGECYTTQETVTLEYDITAAGRYFMFVAAGPNQYLYNCADASTQTYRLSFDFSRTGVADASVVNASFDSDQIRFYAPYNRFYYNGAPVWNSTMTAQVENYYYTQLRDHSMAVVPDANTLAGGYLEDVSISTDDTRGVIVGNIKLKSGFNARYPALGTVYVEVFAKTRTNNVISLGVSQAVQLSTNKSDVVVWNNILNPDKGEKAVVRYDATSAGRLTLKLYTLDGSLITTIFDAEVAAGKGSFDWAGANGSGSKLASGMYILKASGPGISKTSKIVIVR